MSSYIFDQVKGFSINGTLNFNGVPDGTFKIALMDSALVDGIIPKATFSAYTNWIEVSANEIAQTGNYNGTVDLESVNLIEIDDIDGDTLKDYKVYADNVQWVQSTITAYCAVVYRTDGALICVLDIRNNDLPISSNNGVFTLTLNSGSGGFLTIK